MQKIDKSSWGRAHLSLLCFLCHCVTSGNESLKEGLRGIKGAAVPTDKMTINPSEYPHLWGNRSVMGGFSSWDDEWSTKDRHGNKPVTGHCEGAIMDELEEDGWIENVNTGMNPLIALTEKTRQFWADWNYMGGDEWMRGIGATPIAIKLFDGGDIKELKNEK